jgi:hypothetical protein
MRAKNTARHGAPGGQRVSETHASSLQADATLNAEHSVLRFRLNAERQLGEWS